MTAQTARTAVDLAGRDAARRVGIVFFGGEPLLLRELIYETVAYARKSNNNCAYTFRITTNGLLLDDEFIDFARRENFLVSLSLDGVKEAHDAHRRDTAGHSSYDKVSAAAQRLLAVKPNSPALMMVRPDTLIWYASGVEALFNLGFSRVVSSLVYSDDWQEEHLPELTSIT